MPKMWQRDAKPITKTNRMDDRPTHKKLRIKMTETSDEYADRTFWDFINDKVYEYQCKRHRDQAHKYKPIRIINIEQATKNIQKLNEE